MTNKETFKLWGLIVSCIIVGNILLTLFERVFGPVFLLVVMVVTLIWLFVAIKKTF